MEIPDQSFNLNRDTSVKEQLIDNINLLPNYALQAISIIVKDIVVLNSKTKGKRPVFGSGKGKMKIADNLYTLMRKEESKGTIRAAGTVNFQKI
jgi:hypothetical protein